MFRLKDYLFFVEALTLLAVVSGQSDLCGLATSDPAKTCVSIRLPWNPQPIYFCTEKETFTYRDQCPNRNSNICGLGSGRQNNTLLIATPWDCCPLTSNPDSCADQRCPPAPLNRECREIPPNPNTPWECCPTYFCEDNATAETCRFAQLDPKCNNPPPEKSNCIAFVDTFGCCPKFFCDEDSPKADECPEEVDAKNYLARLNGTSITMGDSTPSPIMPITPSPGPADGAGAAGASFFPGPINPGSRSISCIGDFNCPGSLKCCSSDINVYLQDGPYTSRNRNPTHGYCTAPADKDHSARKSQRILARASIYRAQGKLRRP